MEQRGTGQQNHQKRSSLAVWNFRLILNLKIIP